MTTYYIPPTWIPHLKNSSKNSSITIKTRKYDVPKIFSELFFEDTDIERMFFIKLHVNVEFYSELDVDMINPVPAPPITATKHFQPARSSKSMAAWLQEVFLEKLIHFPLDSCTLIDSGCLISGENEFLDAVSDFFMTGKASELEVGRLEVKKSVVLSEKEFKKWVSWYDMIDPYIEERVFERCRLSSDHEEKSSVNWVVFDEDCDYVRVFFDFLDSI